MKILWLLLLICHHGLAQISSKAPSSEYAGVSGNPYFIKDWSDGVIRFSSGKVTDKFKLKFNTAHNRLLLEFSKSTFAAESNVSEFVMYTKNRKDSFVFRKGFPATERGNEETFYQVLENGKATLLRLITKDIVEEKEILASKVSRHYQDVELFYLLHKGAMHKIEKEITPLEGILADRQEELKNYISEQQLKMRTAEDFEKVVKKYNQL
jgi:hypothetical protein